MADALDALLRSQLEALDLPQPEAVRRHLLRFQQELFAWNRKYNLTAIRDPAGSVEKNLVDSLTPLPLIGAGERLIDLGSGAGLPAIPLKIARPDLKVTSVEALEKKILFQRHAARQLGLTDFHPVRARIEDLARHPDHAGAYSLVIARALADLDQLLPWAEPFLAPGGRFIAMKGPAGTEGGEVPEVQGWSLQQERSLQLPASGAVRRLLVFTRERALPAG